ncbi:mechanosensitive ion channel family protein [Edaphobacter flagellatus]|uniref:mechanosensitive ion channel family protein n=1 Tax=Edaphobacter flagellatus TaxID=1933044 RepID=UPI0021B37815|nr:mechanosensitive ion channel family protein [Edaphobacter flagellatus]
MRARWSERVAVLLLLLAVVLPAVSQTKRTAFPAVVMAPVQARFQPAPVRVDNRSIIEISWGFGSISPEVRARAISERLDKLARDTSQAVHFTINETDTSTDIMEDDLVIASVFDGDAAAAGVSRTALANQWLTALSGAVNQYRAEHSRERLLLRIGLTVLVLVVTLALLWLLVPLTRWLADVTARSVFDRLAHSRRQSWSLIDTKELNGLLRLVFRTVRLAASVFVLYLAFQILFSLFPQTRPLGERMLDGVLRPAEQFGRAAWNSAPSLVFILIIALVCRYVLHLVSFAFARIGEGQVRIEGFRPQWAPVTSRLVSLALILLAVLIAYPYIPGSESAAFKGFSLFLGVLVSLGSTGMVANVFNGIVLTYMDSFQTGDFIQIGETQGYVESTSLFVTRLRTRQQRVVTIPNAQVLSSQITNFSTAATNSLTLSTTAGIGYDTPWRQVEAMLLGAARNTRTVRQTPPPFVLEVSLNSFDITYELTVFLTGEVPINVVRAELNRNILDEFNQYGVQIMTPSYVADPAKPAVVAPENWFAEPSEKPAASEKKPDLQP